MQYNDAIQDRDLRVRMGGAAQPTSRVMSHADAGKALPFTVSRMGALSTV
jgi:hypothetical protein